jgi:hypothetical protein
MTTPAASAAVDEHDLYPVHEEDNVPEIGPHEFVVRYLRDVLATRFPDWLVSGNLCIYWEQGNTERYVAPDVFVVPGRPPAPLPRNHLLWRDPPVSFVLEIGSDSTHHADLDEKLAIYHRHVKATEYLYADVERQEIRLWRLGPAGYEALLPQTPERYRSEVLEVEFGWDGAGLLRVYTLDGEALRTHAEAEAQLTQEAQLRREAEARAGDELRRREEAETRAQTEARQRTEAEARAEAETRQRAEEAAHRQKAEARAAQEAARREALERELAELRAQLQRRNDT